MKRFRSKRDEGTTLGLVVSLVFYVSALAIVILFVIPGLIALFN